MSIKRIFIPLVCILLVGLAATATAAASPPTQTLEGVIRSLVADPVIPAGHDAIGSTDMPDDHLFSGQVLAVGNKAYVMTGEQGEANTRVRVTGVPSGGTFDASVIQELGPAGDAVPPTGTTDVLVLLAHWNVPDGVTRASASAQMFTDSNAWYRDASYTALGQTGDVTPWMKIDGPVDGKCFADHLNTMTQAKTAATALGYDLADYDNFVLYSPYNGWQAGSDCNGYAGWAYVGAPNTWLNGYMDRRVTVHEQGHNYGLSHSHSYLCDQVFTGSCTFTDYGDDFDAMGASGLVGHFSAPQKDLLGWMTGRTVDLTAGGRATLAPLAQDALATSAAVIHASANRSYWLEFRQKIDYDIGLPTAATNGVLVHLTDSSVSGNNGSNLVDTRPSDGLSVYTATLRPGWILTTPDGFTITVGSVTPAGATVSVSEQGCVDASKEPDDTLVQARLVAVPSAEHRAFCTARDRDWVKFIGVAGQPVRVETSDLGSITDTVLGLFNSTGKRLAYNDDFGGSRASRIDFTPEVDGTYFVRVREFDGAGGLDQTYGLAISLP